jgi:hypothetical protein
MMTREQLELLSLEELQQLGHKYGVQPLGSYGKRESWINCLLYFPERAIDQMRDGIGIHSPGSKVYDLINQALDLIGTPTDTQMALIRLTVEGQRVNELNLEYYQLKMWELYRVKTYLHQAISLLSK